MLFETKLKMIKATGIMHNTGSRHIRKKAGILVITENKTKQENQKSIWFMTSARKFKRTIMLVRETEVRHRVTKCDVNHQGFEMVKEPYVADFNAINFNDVLGEMNSHAIEAALPAGEKVLEITNYDCK